MVEGLAKADRDRVDIVCFPECFLTGYPDRAEAAREGAFAIDSAQMMQVLDRTVVRSRIHRGVQRASRPGPLQHGGLIVQKAHILGHYSKCSAYMPFHKQGREFPVFAHRDSTFGVVICSDGGYIEPAASSRCKGARVIFSPHFNYIGKEGLIGHFMHVRADHMARAVENAVYFVRGNNVVLGKE